MSVHVVCVKLFDASGTFPLQLIPNTIVWSETMPTADTTAEAAPTAMGGAYAMIVSVDSEANGINLAFDATPNAGIDPRFRQSNNTTVAYAVNGGDKMAWTAVT